MDEEEESTVEVRVARRYTVKMELTERDYNKLLSWTDNFQKMLPTPDVFLDDFYVTLQSASRREF